MAKITKKFLYNVADDYLVQTNDLGKTNEWTYIGPDKIWTFVDNDTGSVGEYNFRTLEENGPTYPTPVGFTKVEVNCEENPLLCTLLRANEYQLDLNALPQKTIDLPDGRVYSRPQDTDPEHTYEATEVKYIDSQWTFGWRKLWVTWEDIYNVRNELVKQAELDLKYLTTLPAHLKEKLQNYIDSLKRIETDWEGFEPYMYVFPDYPL